MEAAVPPSSRYSDAEEDFEFVGSLANILVHDYCCDWMLPVRYRILPMALRFRQWRDSCPYFPEDDSKSEVEVSFEPEKHESFIVKQKTNKPEAIG